MNTTTFRLGIRGKLILGFCMLVLILFLSIGFTLMMITSVKNFTTSVTEDDLPIYDELIDYTESIYALQANYSAFLFTRDAKMKENIMRDWKALQSIQNNIDHMAKNQTYYKDWKQLTGLLQDLKTIHLKSMEISNSTDIQRIYYAEFLPTYNKILDLLSGTLDKDGKRSGGIFGEQYAKLHMDTKLINADLDKLAFIEYILLITGVLVSIIVTFVTSNMIIKHINIFRKQSSRIANGDLTQNITVDTNDELGQLGHDLNKMTASVAKITKEITQASHNMVTTLEEVRHAVDMQSSGATEQAASVNEITASLEEIEKSTSQTMEKAKALGESAEHTREKGQQGLEAIEQSINGMKIIREKVQMIAQTILDLSNQTQQVGEITSVVNNIAQQSKMLALNASIEAAKAGEAGKGFSVVATEVKNLAEQSEKSTQQVQKILEDIRHATEKAVMVTEEGTKGVDQGTILVEQTGEILRSLTDVIHETTVVGQQIEAAVRQESVGIEQITAGMNEINQVTSSFVTSVKQTIEAMENLADVASSLKELINFYKL